VISPEWEDGYAAQTHGTGVDPYLFWLLDSFCQGPQARVLEIGCGIGGSIYYWINRQSDYYGIDGSQSAIDSVHKKYPILRERVTCGDFADGLPGGNFDVIYDRAAMTHNCSADIERTVGHIHEALKPGGVFVASDWFSWRHSEFSRGDMGEDTVTRTGYSDGQFKGVGKVHFFTFGELVKLFKNFQGIMIQERTNRRPGPNPFLNGMNKYRWMSDHFNEEDYISAVWDLVVRREP
jgi:SAM-dependent methyltransferase